ncbi:putative C6 transcription factor [Pleurostoma richardsiae]|uniref:C6 transcription factor n=1 Tax=Pleurostoma richardsiae TaxID=41990 RepID=A0AA38VC53_9PEZI|nr:putative C6 transcription factor [Pleurostoma richardsiae]
MPRPKVKPEDRQRSSKACIACKVSKIRCDSQLPCASCVKKERAGSCVYPASSPEARKRRGLPHHHSAGSRRSSVLGGSYTAGPPSMSELPSPAGFAPLDERRAPSPSPPSPSPVTAADSETRQLPKGRLLISSIGEKVYIGETASLSFLHFLRQTLRPYVGPMSFTDGNRHNVMLEANLNEVHRAEAAVLTPEEQATFLASYLQATSGLLDLFTAPEIELLIEAKQHGEETLPPSVRRDGIAALDMAIAIGAQARGASPSDTQCAAIHFARARQIAFEGMLAHPSLSMVRLFMLLAFYMLGACQRNAAFMYLGVASKAAVVLGLHQPAYYKSLEKDEYAIRLRTWNSLRILDSLTSFILGRPSSLPPTRYDTSSLKEAETQVSAFGRQGQAFNGISRACTLLEEIVQKLSRGHMMDVSVAETLLDKLREWSTGLPPAVRQFSVTGGTSPDWEMLVGNMHVACVYYFAVILVTRPFLIAHLMSSLRSRSTGQTSSMADERAEMVARLAQVCLGSAMYMADTCHRVKMAGYAFGNLCLVKAWIFGAGLVLGFSLFAGEPRQDVQDSFDSAHDILRSLAAASPQARLYYDILSNFSDAIARYRRRLSYETRRSVHQYMDQILVVDVDNGGSSSSNNNNRSAGAAGCHYPSPGGSRDAEAAGGGPDGNGGLGPEDLFPGAGGSVDEFAQCGGDMDMLGDFQGWDDIAMQLAGDFAMNYQPLENLFL